MQMEIEEAALKKEDDRLSKNVWKNYRKNLPRCEKTSKQERQDGRMRKLPLRVSKLREEIESVNSEIQIAQRNYDLNKAAELQYGRLPELKKQLEERRTRSERRSFYGQRIRHRR